MFGRALSERSGQFFKTNPFFLTCYWRLLIETIKIPIGTNNWDVETYMNNLKKNRLWSFFHKVLLT